MLHIFTKGRGGGATTVHRRLASSLTPEEAGRRAEEKVKSALKNQESLSSSSALSSIAAHAGIEHGPNAPMAPPLHLATTYTRPADGLYLESDSTYSRHDNPTRLQLEKTMASLETHQLRLDKKTTLDEEVICCAFSSGMMAVSSIFLAHSSPVTVILPEDLYHGVPTLIHEVFQRHNISICQIDMRKSENISKTLSSLDTTMDVIVWVETPSNPKCHVLDIQEICSLVRSTTINATIVVDSTMAPPVITQPLLYGADLVMHSGTKGIAGHSDALLGLVTASPLTEKGKILGPLLRQVQIAVGGVASSLDSWLALRGIRTLAVRVERQSNTAMEVAKFLEQNPLVKEVHYPGLQSHPQHEIAKLQMSGGFGSVLSLEMEDEVVATALAAALTTIQRATSLGGTETLIEHRSSIEPPDRTTSPPGLLRLSIGLEDAKDLISDLDRALLIAKEVAS